MNNDIIFQYIEEEKQRQQQNLELIASENIVSQNVLKALGSELTNKYAEGYPNKRYYGGCEYVDKIEIEAQERAKKLFNAEYVNVQPHSGTQANMAVYNAVLDIGDTVMAMDLSAGGHLSHFSKVSMAGRYYNAVHYGVDKTTHMIDYDEVLKLAKQHKPKLIVCGASAYPRVIDFKKFRQIADEVGAYLMADIAHIAGLVAVGEHPSPFPWCDFVTSTTQKTLRGPRGGIIMCKKEYAKQIDSAVFPRNQGGPLMNNIAAKAICFGEALTDSYKAYIRQVCNNAKTLATTLQLEGIDLLTNGTDNHLLLLDLRKTGVTGKELEKRLETINITVNKNMIPFDPQKPNITSGIRIGTPAVTSRGMGENEMELISDIITIMVFSPELESTCSALVQDLTERFPII